MGVSSACSCEAGVRPAGLGPEVEGADAWPFACGRPDATALAALAPAGWAESLSKSVRRSLRRREIASIVRGWVRTVSWVLSRVNIGNNGGGSGDDFERQ